MALGRRALSNLDELKKGLSVKFDPQPGDRVEFNSDLQTDKGPSTGSVVAVNGDEVIIRHSDAAVDKFSKSKMQVKCHKPEKKLWILSYNNLVSSGHKNK